MNGSTKGDSVGITPSDFSPMLTVLAIQNLVNIFSNDLNSNSRLTEIVGHGNEAHSSDTSIVTGFVSFTRIGYVIRWKT